jgi:hypothetical protein|tara:strand:+ start:292 stop:585 length:294 start_codon:yes stop_codon:yes gene_type:complete
MGERNLVPYEIYSVIPEGGIRKGIYLGQRTDKGIKNKHVIVTRRYRSPGNPGRPIMYRFDEFGFDEEGVLSFRYFTIQQMSYFEEEYVKNLLTRNRI